MMWPSTSGGCVGMARSPALCATSLPHICEVRSQSHRTYRQMHGSVGIALPYACKSGKLEGNMENSQVLIAEAGNGAARIEAELRAFQDECSAIAAREAANPLPAAQRLNPLPIRSAANEHHAVQAQSGPSAVGPSRAERFGTAYTDAAVVAAASDVAAYVTNHGGANDGAELLKRLKIRLAPSQNSQGNLVVERLNPCGSAQVCFANLTDINQFFYVCHAVAHLVLHLGFGDAERWSEAHRYVDSPDEQRGAYSRNEWEAHLFAQVLSRGLCLPKAA